LPTVYNEFFRPGSSKSIMKPLKNENAMNRSRGPKPVAIQLSERQQSLLEAIVQCRRSPQYEVVRASIILEANRGKRNRHIADKLGIGREMVVQWRKRWAGASRQLDEIESEKDDKALRSSMRSALQDAPRSGCPGTFTPEQICRIVALACEATEGSQRPISEWTPRELTDEVIKRGIVSSISVRSVGRFLKSGGSKAS
jgi:putative transposase